MTEVRKHKRQLASGRTANVRRHHRNTGSGGEDPRPEPVFDPGRRAPSVDSDALGPAAAPPPRESWWDDDGQPAEGDWWDGEEEASRDCGHAHCTLCGRCLTCDPHPAHTPPLSELGKPQPGRLGDSEMPGLQEEMRHWRSQPEPTPSPARPMNPQLAKALGCDTPEGLAVYERGRAYREAGYDGPLDAGNRIPDPDDPANHETLHTLAAMRESSTAAQQAGRPAAPRREVVVNMRHNRTTAMANARVSRRREKEALEQGDIEGARIQRQIAEDYESDADFWGQVGGGGGKPRG